MPLDDPGDADAPLVAEACDGRQLTELPAGGARHCLGNRMLGGVLDRTGEAQDVGTRGSVQRRDLDELELALGDRAGLVEHDRRDLPCLLEHPGSLDQNPELGAASGADHQRGRRREPERARARDDENGDRRRERRRRRGAEDEPAGERCQRDHEHDRDEDGRDAICEPLHRRLPGLGRFDEPRDLCERRVGPDLGRTHDEAAVCVDRRPDDLRRRLDLDRHGLAGQLRLVDRRFALDDDPVGRHLLAGTNDEQVTDLETARSA